MMKRGILCVVSWVLLLTAAGGWVWWVLEYSAARDVRIAVLGGAVLLALGAFVGLDRGDRPRVYVLAVYSSVLLLCGGTVWLEVVRPALEVGPVRFAAGLLSLDTRSGLLVLGSVFGTGVVALVWCDLAGRILARKADEKKKRARSEVFGKSRLLEREYMRKLERAPGLLLGQTRGGAGGPLLGWPLEGSAVTLAPPRTGKGATIALNYLAPGGRGWNGSTVLIDPRGETWCIVARRRREMGRRVVLIDPFGVVAAHKNEMEEKLHLPDVASRSYNPLDFIREDAELAPRDINVLLDALLTPPSGSNDTSAHFYDSAGAFHRAERTPDAPGGS